VEGLMQEIGTTAKQEQGIAGIRVLHDVRHADEEIPSAEYPLSLAIRDVLQHSGSMSTRSKSLDLVVSEPYLEVSEDDATKLGVIDNGHVKVSSRRGTIYLKAKVTDTVPMGPSSHPRISPMDESIPCFTIQRTALPEPVQ